MRHVAVRLQRPAALAGRRPKVRQDCTCVGSLRFVVAPLHPCSFVRSARSARIERDRIVSEQASAKRGVLEVLGGIQRAIEPSRQALPEHPQLGRGLERFMARLSPSLNASSK